MAWWITVYCRAPVQLDAATIASGLRNGDPAAPAGVDYYCLAEEYGIDEDAVAPALSALRVDDYGLEVHFGDPRPVVVHIWDEPARVSEEIEECREVRAPPPGVEPWISACRAVVGIELGFSMAGGMGVAFAYELAAYAAQKFDGVFVDDEGEWRRVEDGAFVDP